MYSGNSLDRKNFMINTFIKSRTYDIPTKTMYPDKLPVWRHVSEIERLLLDRKHEIEWRDGYRIVRLNWQRFETLIPRFPGYVRYNPATATQNEIMDAHIKSCTYGMSKEEDAKFRHLPDYSEYIARREAERKAAEEEAARLRREEEERRNEAYGRQYEERERLRKERLRKERERQEAEERERREKEAKEKEAREKAQGESSNPAPSNQSGSESSTPTPTEGEANTENESSEESSGNEGNESGGNNNRRNKKRGN